ncbi:hypothetical protein L195_g041717, partial [Trifolium pratense]
MPLSWRLPDDKLLWHGEKDGLYSVRSTYHLLGTDKRVNQPESSSSNHNKMWSKIWSLPLPNKIKNFTWRLAKHIIPTCGNLQRRRVVLDPICPLCFMDQESDDHLFMQCPLVLQVWFASSLGAHPPQCLFNNVVFDPMFVARSAGDFVFEFNGANPALERRFFPVVSLVWETPPPLFLKTNVGVGICNNGQVCWGMVIRNENAEVIFTATKRTDMRADPVLAEALALRWGINVVTDLRLNNAIFEIDVVNVVDCCKGIKSIASIAPFIVDCNELLS